MATPEYKIRIPGEAKGLDAAVKGALGSLKRLAGELGGLQALAGKALTFSGIGGAASVAGLLTAARNIAGISKELSFLAQISGTSVEEFQRLSFAAKTVGVEQDKLGDIFKDVQDKVGDFLETGGGALADFFENIAPRVGVTAEQFRNLSGPQALQLYVDSLQKANVSQTSMVFYLEAIASDATRLLPLLRYNGAAFRELGAEAQSAGAILGEKLVAEGVELERNLDRLSTIGRGFAIIIGSAIIPALNDLAGEFLSARQAGMSFFESIAAIGLTNPGKSPAEQIADLANEVERIQRGDWSEVSLFEKLAPEDSIRLAQQRLKYFQLELQRDASSSEAAIASLSQELADVQGNIAKLEAVQAQRGGYLNNFDKSALDRFRQEAAALESRIDVLRSIVGNAEGGGAQGLVEAEKKAAAERKNVEESLAKERQRLFDLVAVKHGLANSSILKDGAERHKAEMARAKELATEYQKTYSAAIQGAKNAAAEVKKLKAEADQAVKDASQAAQARRDNIPEPTGGLRGSSAGQSEERDARDLIDSARGDAAIANMAALNGNLDRAAQFAERASSSAQAAWDLVGKIKDDGAAAKLFDEIGEIQKDAKNAETKVAESNLGEFEQQAAEALQNLRAQLAEIDRLKSVEIDADISKASTAIDELQKKLDAMPAKKVVEVEMRTTSTGAASPQLEGPPQPDGSFWSGGYTGPGGKFEPAGIVHRGEYVLPQEIVRQSGALAFLERLRRHGMSALKGYASGGLVSNINPGSISANAVSGSSSTPVVLDLGALGRYSTSAESEVADQLVRVFQRAALQRGRRK
jgi:hypothetical protein